MRRLISRRPAAVPASALSPMVIATAIVAAPVLAGVMYLVWPQLTHSGAFTPYAPAASAIPLHPPSSPSADWIADEP